MKFLLDMGISPETGKYLIKLGHDAVHLIDKAMDRSSDFEIQRRFHSRQSAVAESEPAYGNNN